MNPHSKPILYRLPGAIFRTLFLSELKVGLQDHYQQLQSISIKISSKYQHEENQEYDHNLEQRLDEQN